MSGGLLEPGLTTPTLDFHRAIASLQEELEAIDFYHQRVEHAGSPDLKGVLAHNRNDEMEHAAMLIEWLRRTTPEMDLQLKKFLFTTGDLPLLAKGLPAAAGGLGLGNLEAFDGQGAHP